MTLVLMHCATKYRETQIIETLEINGHHSLCKHLNKPLIPSQPGNRSGVVFEPGLAAQAIYLAFDLWVRMEAPVVAQKDSGDAGYATFVDP